MHHPSRCAVVALLSLAAASSCSAEATGPGELTGSQSSELRTPPSLNAKLPARSNGVLPKAAGPRTGTIHVVNVQLGAARDLGKLVEGDYDIASRKGDTVTIYATDQELTELEKSFHVVSIERRYDRSQPQRRPTGERGLGTYHSYESMTRDLAMYAAAHPSIARLSSVGKTHEGRDLWALRISDNPDAEEDEPELAYISSMHGDEILGVEMCMYFIDLLLKGYRTDARITHLIDNAEIWIMPLMNPDGFVSGDRYNAQGYDLNRSFPDGAETNIGNLLDGPAMGLSGRPVEVNAVMRWRAAHNFTLSANFHGGATVVNYPYDNDGHWGYSACPDDQLFIFLSKTYSSHNGPMWTSYEFDFGIVNGGDWYVIDGGMQDWVYRYLGGMEVTIELSDNKQPPQSQVPTFWHQNKESMLAFFEQGLMGIRGVVTDASSGAPVHAAVTINSNTHLTFTDPDVGDYHRLALPGTYTLTVRAPGYGTQTVSNVVVTEGNATRVDVELVAR